MQATSRWPPHDCSRADHPFASNPSSQADRLPVGQSELGCPRSPKSQVHIYKLLNKASVAAKQARDYTHTIYGVSSRPVDTKFAS